MARNIRWFVSFKAFDGTSCRVNIYDNDWPAGVSMGLQGAADPFFFEEGDSDDLLNDVLRYRTGYIRVMEQTVGQLNAIYPTSRFERYVEFLYGGNVVFNGYIQVQDFSRTLTTLSTTANEPCTRVVEFPVISPMGLFSQRTFTTTPFNPPTTVTLGELLDIVMADGAYEKVTFPNITGTGFDKSVYSHVVCPFNSDYHHSMTNGYMDKMFAPRTYAFFIEAICKAYGWICHDTPQALVFTSFDYQSRYVKYPVGHIGESGYRQNESFDQVAEALTTYFTPTDAKARLATLLPETGIEVDYEGDDGNPDFTLDRTYYNGVEMISSQDPRELTSICNLIAPLQLHEVTGCGNLTFDNTGKVNIGTGIVAWNGNDGILMSMDSSWADGRELFVIRLYRRIFGNYNFSMSYDIMTSERNIAALDSDTEDATQAHFAVTFNTSQDYIEAHFIYHYGQVPSGGVLPTEPLPDNYLVFIHNISFEWYADGEPYASYKYMPASKGDIIPANGYPAVTASVTMPISLYRYNDRMIGDTLLTSKVTEYPYLFQKRTELVGKFRGTSPDLLHTRLFTFMGKKWRAIAMSWHPWSEAPFTLTLQSSPVLDGNVTVFTITASAANTSLSGFSDTVNQGQSWSTVITADSGYSISSVTIVMGNTDITSTAYNASTGVISIASVTGNVVITAVAAGNMYSVFTDLTNITSNAPAQVQHGAALQVTLTPSSGYAIDDSSVVVTMGGVALSGVYSSGVVTINSVTGNVSITAEAEEALPYDAEVEYLETDGNAYIDTGVNTSSTTKFDMSIYLPTTPTDGSIFPFGARKVSNTNTMEFLRSKDTSIWNWRFGNKRANTAFGSSQVDGDYTINNVTAARTVAFTCGGDSHSISATSNTFDTGLNFYLFCLNNNGTPRATESGIKIYSCKMYSGSTLARDYIPVRKNGVGYLYDKVSKTLFGNAAGTGSFTYGNDKTT